MRFILCLLFGFLAFTEATPLSISLAEFKEVNTETTLKGLIFEYKDNQTDCADYSLINKYQILQSYHDFQDLSLNQITTIINLIRQEAYKEGIYLYDYCSFDQENYDISPEKIKKKYILYLLTSSPDDHVKKLDMIVKSVITLYLA
jgi:hypothetical protein